MRDLTLGESDPQHPRHQPGPHRQTPVRLATGRSISGWTCSASIWAGSPVRQHPRPARRSDKCPRASRRPLDTCARRHRVRSSAGRRDRDRLGDQTHPDRPLHGQTRPGHDRRPNLTTRPRLPRHQSQTRAVLPDVPEGPAGQTDQRYRGLRSEIHPPQTTRAKLRGDFIKRAQEKRRTSPSTGCTSNSMTRPSAPCSARTRSRASMSGWNALIASM